MTEPKLPYSGVVIALDLEMNQPSQSIIEIGAVAGNVWTGQLFSRFTTKVQLPAGEVLDPRITALCNIQPEELTGAPSLPNAFKLFGQWMDTYPDRWVNPVVWGHGDVKTLREQLGSEVEVPFGRRELDAKTVYSAWRLAQGAKPEGGLARALTHVGLNFEGRKHTATDDAFNTFRIWIALQKQFAVRN